MCAIIHLFFLLVKPDREILLAKWIAKLDAHTLWASTLTIDRVKDMDI